MNHAQFEGSFRVAEDEPSGLVRLVLPNDVEVVLSLYQAKLLAMALNRVVRDIECRNNIAALTCPSCRGTVGVAHNLDTGKSVWMCYRCGTYVETIR